MEALASKARAQSARSTGAPYQRSLSVVGRQCSSLPRSMHLLSYSRSAAVPRRSRFSWTWAASDHRQSKVRTPSRKILARERVTAK